MDKKLLNIKEICEYLGIGETKARELVRGHNGFGVRIGNRWYADKKQLGAQRGGVVGRQHAGIKGMGAFQCLQHK